VKKLTVLLLFAALVVLLSECRQSASSVQDQVTIYSARSEYCAWPSIIRAANGDLLVTFCRSEEHLAPDGQIVLMRSSDNGLTWQGPHVIFDTILDDRECGMTVLRDGRILVHLYTYQFTRDYYEKLPKNAYEPQVLCATAGSLCICTPTSLPAIIMKNCRKTPTNRKSWIDG